jgi:hypothetical protein
VVGQFDALVLFLFSLRESAMRVLLDENLLLDLLFARPKLSGHGELLWELFEQRRIEGCVTDFGLETIWHYTSRLRNAPTAKALLHGLYQVLTCYVVPPAIFQAAEQSSLALPFAIQVESVEQLDLDGIVTARPLDYHPCVDFDSILIYTPGHLLADFLAGSLDEQRQKLEAKFEPPLPSLPGNSPITTVGLRLEHIEVCCGSERPVATVAIQSPRGRVYRETAMGVGPVDASFKAINLATERFLPMVDTQMLYYKSLGTTSDSEVSAMVLLQRRDALFPGRGFHPDIVMASAYAYVDALNYMLYCENS